MAPLPTAPTRNRGKPTEASGATFFGPWCNGSTSDFDSLCSGSIPDGPANWNVVIKGGACFKGGAFHLGQDEVAGGHGCVPAVDGAIAFHPIFCTTASQGD